MEVGLPWTSAIDLLPMALFVGSMLNGADVLTVLYCFPSLHILFTPHLIPSLG